MINGQKLWTTGGHLASHVWLATRTDPDATPRHAGITVQQHRALSGEISCTVLYDDGLRLSVMYVVGGLPR